MHIVQDPDLANHALVSVYSRLESNLGTLCRQRIHEWATVVTRFPKLDGDYNDDGGNDDGGFGW